MPPDRTHATLIHRLSCHYCRRTAEGPHHHGRADDLPELTRVPTAPEYSSAAVPGVLLPVDADDLHAVINEGIQLRVAEGAAALRAVLSSVLHSEAFSPKERADIVESARIQLEEGYGLDWEGFRKVLSERMPGLGPKSMASRCAPLEHEILRWDPIWEGNFDNVGRYSDGTEMLYYLISNWAPPYEDDPDEGLETSSDVSEESQLATQRQLSRLRAAPHQRLLDTVRNACLRRSNNGVEEEEASGRLFQRIVRFVVERVREGENINIFPDREGQGYQYRDSFPFANYSASVVYDPEERYNDRGNVKPSIRLVQYARSDTVCGFTALIALYYFKAVLGEAKFEARRIRSDATAASDVPHAQNSQADGRWRARPYNSSRATTSLNLQNVDVPGSHVETHSSALQVMLSAEFLAMRRVWMLSVGKDSLELSVITPNAASSLPLQEKVITCAEVRVICPVVSGRIASPEWEYVFTFDDLELPALSPIEVDILSVRQSDNPQYSRATIRLDKCFPDHCAFDDKRLLHEDGALILELRVRFRRAMAKDVPWLSSEIQLQPSPPPKPTISASSISSSRNSQGTRIMPMGTLPLSSENTTSEVLTSDAVVIAAPASSEESFAVISNADISSVGSFSVISHVAS